MPDTNEILTEFTAGDLVISISGDGDGSGNYTDNQASPIVLEEITTSGTVVGTMVLPQTTTVVNGVTEYSISGEYGSSSEGALQLSADGQSLTIMGYGVDAQTYNAGGAAVYGNAALAQSTSVPGGPFTPVARVVADISYNGKIDTSTAIYNIDDTNNPRSVATANGTSFYISGQGVKGDTTQGVFLAQDGASSATAIDTSTDTRSVEIVDGVLYVSRDSTQGAGGTSNVESYGGLPTGATAGTTLSGVDGTITLTAAQENSVNAGAVGTTIHLSPEAYFFADANTLYIADGGNPKEGGLGDGGLQKWVFDGSSWNLEYTLSAGLNLVPDTATSGTTGLIGLTGTVVGGTVYLYATNSALGDLDQTYLYGIADSLAATSGAGESFTVLQTAAPDTNIRGVSFAPSAAATTPTATVVSAGVTSTGVVVTSGSTLTILNGGTAVAATVMSGGSTTVSAGGVDSGSSIAQGGTELVLGSATGDVVGGTQVVSAATAVVSNETILNGGSVELFLKGATASGLTVGSNGVLNISGNATAADTVIDGGTVELLSAKAVLSGSLTFSGAGTIVEAATVSSGFGDLAVISGFGAGDVIDLTSATSAGAAGPSATLGTTTSNGNTYATVSGGGSSETFIFAGTAIAAQLQLASDGNGGVDLIYVPPTAVNVTVSSGVTSSGITVAAGGSVDVLNGGTLTDSIILNGGAATIETGGLDLGSVISGGATETVAGSATLDQVHGVQLLNAASSIVSNETIYAGGTVELFLAGSVGSALTATSGGVIAISGRGTLESSVLSGGSLLILESPKATLSGSLTFDGAATLEETATISATSAGILFGDQAVISGFGAGAAIDLTSSTAAGGAGAAATFSTTTSGGNTYATVSGGGSTETFIFAGTTIGSSLSLVSDGHGGEEIIFGSATSSGTTPPPNTIVVSGGTTSTGLTISNGTTLDVQSGGTASAATIQAGGLAIVESGGVDSGSTLSAGSNETVLGSATGDQVFGTQLVSAATAIVSGETVYAGGSVDLFLKGAAANGLTLSSGGSLNISGNATASDTVINGGTIDLESPKATLSGTVTFEGAGTIEATDVISGGFGDLGVIFGFGAGGVIDETLFGSDTTLGITTSAGNTVATMTSGSVSESFTFAGTSIGSSLILTSDGHGGEALETACFLPGTRILTERGEVLVEELAVGDGVVTAGGVVRPLCWIGQGRALAPAGRRSAATPLIVRRGALADNVPSHDLRITKGHSLYLDDVLIPVEFLVNHRSILWDDHAREVTVYHLELDQHAVLFANGAAAESYRDDGNRWLFRNANSGWDQPAKAACAPVLTGGPIVDAVWRRLLERAGGESRIPLTEEPDLHLLVDGVRVDGVRRSGGVYAFGLTGQPQSVRIVSRTVVPQEVGLARDARCLGVALRRIEVASGDGRIVVRAGDELLSDGFHMYESDNDFVWTDGDATVPAALLAGATGIALTVAGTTRYVDQGVRLLVA